MFWRTMSGAKIFYIYQLIGIEVYDNSYAITFKFMKGPFH